MLEEHQAECLTQKLEDIVADKRIDVFDAFASHVVFACSPKMRSRVKHPLSNTYYSCLMSINAALLEHYLLATEITVNQPARTRDLPLCYALLHSASKSDVFPILQISLSRTKIPDLPLGFNFNTLRAALKALEAFHDSQGEDMSNCPPLYTKDTAVEFHYLLLTVLSEYHSTIHILGQPDKGLTSKQYSTGYLFIFLLWRIAHSSILREHLAFLNAAGLLSIFFQTKPGSGPAETQTKAQHKSAGSGQDADADAVDQELNATLHAKPSMARQATDLGIATLRWLRLLVCPITALETISLACIHSKHRNTKIEIRIVDLTPVGREDEFDWTSVLSDALLSKPELSLPQALDKIRKTIKDGFQGSPLRSTLRQFTSGSQIVRESGVTHCELAAVSLILYLDRATPVEGRALHLDVCFCLSLNINHPTDFFHRWMGNMV